MDSLSSDNIIFSKEFRTLSLSVAKFANKCNLQKKFAMSVISFLCVSGRLFQFSMALGKSFSLKYLSCVLNNGLTEPWSDIVDLIEQISLAKCSFFSLSPKMSHTSSIVLVNVCKIDVASPPAISAKSNDNVRPFDVVT